MKLKTIQQIGLVLIFSLTTAQGLSQNIDLSNLKNIKKAKPVKVAGGIAANALFSDGTGNTGRSPFSYFLQGNVNINLFGQLNLPFSFNLTNNGSDYNYPTVPNRLSLHPQYKWVAGHIGDVAMTFSPYTLNGHQFTGIGIDATPDGPFKFSLMYGRLQRAVSYDTTNVNVPPAYKRMGYGAKLSLDKSRYKVGLSVFTAKDMLTSIQGADSLQVFPQQNTAISGNVGIRPLKGLELSAEYAISALTRDVRDSITKQESKRVFKLVMPANGSTDYYKALKAGLNYTFRKSTLGLGYERIDPGYQSLGAYYFNNDLENITVNAAQSLLKDKATIAVSVGYQRDDLDHAKAGSTSRNIGSINVNYTPSPKLQIATSYSNFQTFMNMRSQFDYINQNTPVQNFDTLDFTQLSQNANLAINYQVKQDQTQQHSLSINASFQDAYDQQGGIILRGNASQFYNLAAAYSITLLQKGIGITTAYNASYNTIGRNKYLTMGPTAAFNAKLLKKKMNTNVSASYNFSNPEGEQKNSVWNVRMNASYTVFRKHNLNASVINQWRQANKNNTRLVTGTLGYSYAF
jgi:hypothetical protein